MAHQDEDILIFSQIMKSYISKKTLKFSEIKVKNEPDFPTQLQHLWEENIGSLHQRKPQINDLNILEKLFEKK